ncbi:MAG TPA: DUF5655 domain-containing protein [Candidatus Thermoplasmatota archaeon]|nr:DUF5655 domain-containing protein [Candidatus Thermoplasmatota archaeon]
MAPSSDAESTIAIAEFVKRLRPDPRTGFLTLRALVVSLGPDVVERVTPSAVVYARRDKPFLKVEALRATRLAVAFPASISPDDAMGRLLRRGDERYFRLEKPDDLDGHCQEFVRKAYAAAR